MMKATARLKVGGCLVMSVEVALDRPTSMGYLGHDLLTSDLLKVTLPKELGLELIGPFDEYVDAETLDRVSDSSIENGGLDHHFVASREGILHTTAVLFFRKIAEPRANAAWHLFSATLRLAPQNMLHYMKTTERGEREKGALRSVPGTARGYFAFGPYFRLPAGRYRLRCRVKARSVLQWIMPVLAIDVSAGGDRHVFAKRRVRAGALLLRSLQIDFEVPPELGLGSRGCEPIEFRFKKVGAADLAIESMELSLLPGQ